MGTKRKKSLILREVLSKEKMDFIVRLLSTKYKGFRFRIIHNFIAYRITKEKYWHPLARYNKSLNYIKRKSYRKFEMYK